MTFRCPTCDARTLAIAAALELPSDSRSDEIAVQLLSCLTCGFSAAGVYEESRRGPLDRESWDHRGLVLSPDSLVRLRRLLRRCPRPRDANCRCAAHRLLSERDETGRWRGLQNVAEVLDSFPLER